MRTAISYASGIRSFFIGADISFPSQRADLVLVARPFELLAHGSVVADPAPVALAALVNALGGMEGKLRMAVFAIGSFDAACAQHHRHRAPFNLAPSGDVSLARHRFVRLGH